MKRILTASLLASLIVALVAPAAGHAAERGSVSVPQFVEETATLVGVTHVAHVPASVAPPAHESPRASFQA